MADDRSIPITSISIPSSSGTAAATLASARSGVHAADNEHLSDLIPELLFEILIYLSTSDFLSLVQTSQSLRRIIRNSADYICNKVIRTRFAAVADLLDTIMIEGWLTPTHPAVLACEGYMIKEKSLIQRMFPGHSSSDLDITTRLSQPGPQYLQALEQFGGQVLATFRYHALTLDSTVDLRLLWRNNLPFTMEMDRLMVEMLKVANAVPRNRISVATCYRSWRDDRD